MADNLQQHGGQDREPINVHQDRELWYWSKKFGGGHSERVEEHQKRRQAT